MNYLKHIKVKIFLILTLLLMATACAKDASQPPIDASELSRITEISSSIKNIDASQGGALALDEFTVNFPQAALPADAQIKVSKVSVSNSDEDDAEIIDMTKVYILCTTSATDTVELTKSAGISFKINSAGFDKSSIRLVVWDGYEWDEVPSSFDEASNIVSSTVNAILPFGTRIYVANPEASSSKNRDNGEQIVSEFVAMKIVGEMPSSAKAQMISAKNVADGTGRDVDVLSPLGKFRVEYQQTDDPVKNAALQKLAKEVAGYMDNAYTEIVLGMGLKQPTITVKPGYGAAWPVELKDLKGEYYGSADAGTNEITIGSTERLGDDLSHTCHHEFTHLVQFKTLKDAKNNVDDTMDWFGETMADAVGYYAQKKRGTIYSLASATNMGDFDIRLDADKNVPAYRRDTYEYNHFPFISYLLAKCGEASFKKFFETWYSYSPGKTEISMRTIDKAASTAGSLGKSISGREGIFWDFYLDYFINGSVFNKGTDSGNGQFLNMPARAIGAPFEITDANKKKQGATIVEVDATTSHQQEFTLERLSGKALIYRYKSGGPFSLQVTVNASTVKDKGRIQLVAFRRVGGVLQFPAAAKDVNDGSVKDEFNYPGFGKDFHDVYVVMTNTSYNEDGYVVKVNASVVP